MVFAGDDFVSNKKLYTWGVYHHMLLTKILALSQLHQ